MIAASTESVNGTAHQRRTIRVVPLELLEALAAEAPAAQRPGKPSAKASSSRPTNGANGASTSRGPSASAQKSTGGDRSADSDIPRHLKVEDWLSDAGRSFTRKQGASGDGWTVWHLECPFDPSHTGTDACIMQHPGGALMAKCHHNSCAGKKWEEFKQAIGAPKAHHYDPPFDAKTWGRNERLKDAEQKAEQKAKEQAEQAPKQGHDLPEIKGNEQQLRWVTEAALAAAGKSNNPPRVFQAGGGLCRVRRDPVSKAVSIEHMNSSATRGFLARVANWMEVRHSKDGDYTIHAPPPKDVVQDLLSLPDLPAGENGFPVLQRLVECPVFAADGSLVDAQGYNARALIYLELPSGLSVPTVPSNPTAEERAEAKRWLLTELMGDFPLVDDASKAHALAATLLPFVRAMIDGPTPFHLFDAPCEGTGKTLLASAIAHVATGHDAEILAEGKDDEEWRKRLSAILASCPTFVLLDNLNRMLDSGALAAVLTCKTWKDRILGQTKTLSIPNQAVWMGSGNNVRLSRELVRRTIWSRLDAHSDAPWERTGFKHRNLLAWVKQNRGRLIWAALTLVQAWIAARKPAGQQTLGMFESWAEVMGGILDVAEVPGLLDNAKEFRAARADQSAEWREFLGVWWTIYREQAVGVKELYTLAKERQLLDQVLGDEGERSQRTRLGRHLGKMLDRVCGEFRMVAAKQDNDRCQKYKLEKIEVQEAQPEPAATTSESDGATEYSA